MEKQRLQWLMQQYMAGTLSSEEEVELAQFIRSDAAREQFNTVLAEMMQQQEAVLPGNEARWQQLVQGILEMDKPTPVRRMNWKRWMVAAAAVLLIVFGVNEYRRDRLITTSTRQLLLLPDSTQVWLNAASTLTYPSTFDDKERVVELSGEAWFDVQHAAERPFLIRTGAITTRVVGTAFDIKAYHKQKALVVSVQRGTVKIEAAGKTLITLTKGEQARITGNNQVDKRLIDTAAIASWKQGNLIYTDETVQTIIDDLQRVFDAKVVVRTPALLQEVITVTIKKDGGIQQSLEVISRIIDARLRKENETYIIE